MSHFTMSFDFKNIISSISLKENNNQPARVMGIDIGASSIKVIELEQTKQALTLRTYGELQLGPYAEKKLGEAVTLEPKKLTEAVVDVIRESGVQAATGVLSIPLNSSFVTVVPISVKETENLEAKLKIEARKYIPVPLTDVILDWSELRSYGDKSVKIHEVLLAAIERDAFTRYQKLMADVKMSSQPAEIEVFSTIRGLVKPSDTSVAIIDLGAETSKLYVSLNGSLERIHRVYEGGSSATKRVATLLDISFEEAENRKRAYQSDDTKEVDVKKAYMSTVERCFQEFKRVIEQYEARQGTPIKKVILTGGAAAFPGVDIYLSDILNRQVEKATPFDRVAYPAFMEDILKEAGLSFATALGAALRPFEEYN
jgi:type IV pilus assembly protein PilM